MDFEKVKTSSQHYKESSVSLLKCLDMNQRTLIARYEISYLELRYSVNLCYKTKASTLAVSATGYSSVKVVDMV